MSASAAAAKSRSRCCCAALSTTSGGPNDIFNNAERAGPGRSSVELFLSSYISGKDDLLFQSVPSIAFEDEDEVEVRN